MNELQDFAIVGDHAEYRATGETSLHQAIQLITSGITFARERKIENLMVVTLGLTGFQPPNVIDRYYFINDWAKASCCAVRVATVNYGEMIDRKKFGVTVGLNIGFDCEPFTSEEQALAWLRSLRQSGHDEGLQSKAAA